MSVYTSVTEAEMAVFLEDYDIGTLVSLKGIAQGITNTNYFVTTSVDRYVLTIFETLLPEELPFFLDLMALLSQKGVACPAPIAQKSGQFMHLLHDKAACLVSCLAGRDVTQPNAAQCRSVGAMLAKMHVATADTTLTMANPRHASWWEVEQTRLLPLLSEADAELLQSTIAFLQAHPDTDLPQGLIHADLFKDNVLLEGDEVTGFIDFYYACRGSFVYDIAIALNDWAQDSAHQLDEALVQAFLAGYNSVRPLSPEEQAYLPIAQQAGCIRFWVSRLLDYHFPPEGEMTFTKNPAAFRDLLLSINNQ
ncbi:MAG: homoserine kinase [Neisseriaceae bacterium]|nr:homoserine kinase [Neisseriaceae bacterium]